jgi:hypothetical protein
MEGRHECANVFVSCNDVVIPAKAGIQNFLCALDSRFRGNDGVTVP